MKHRHPGAYRSRTKKGGVIHKRRPIHSHSLRRKYFRKYQPIVDRAKAKGYEVFDIDREQSTVDEVDIPEIYRTDGLIVPDHDGKQRRDLIYIDDDAPEDYQIKAFAHELGHQHLFATGQDDESSNSNIELIEKQADKIGADILGMSIKKFNTPDVTFHDVVINERRGFFGPRESDDFDLGENIARQVIDRKSRDAVLMDPEDVKIITRGVKEDFDAGIDKTPKSRWRRWIDED